MNNIAANVQYHYGKAYMALSNPRFVRQAISYALLAVALCSTMASPDLLAAGTKFGDIGTSINSQGAGVASALRIVIYLMGFGMVGAGLYMWATASKKNQPMSWGVMCTVFGSLMLAVNYIINSTTQTLFGTDVTGQDAQTVLGGG